VVLTPPLCGASDDELMMQLLASASAAAAAAAGVGVCRTNCRRGGLI